MGPVATKVVPTIGDSRLAPATRNMAPHGATFQASVLQNEPDDGPKRNEPTAAPRCLPDLVMPQQVTPAVSLTQERKYDVRTHPRRPPGASVEPDKPIRAPDFYPRPLLL